MTPITQNEHLEETPSKGARENAGTTGRWFRPLHKNVPAEFLKYYEWPMWVEREVNAKRVFNGVVVREDENGDIPEEAETRNGDWLARNRDVQVDSRTDLLRSCKYSFPFTS
jgi:hypothetical protein